MLRRVRGSLTTKVVLPIVVWMLIAVGAVTWWTMRQATIDFEADSERQAESVFRELERSIYATGGSPSRAIASMKLDSAILAAVVVAGPDGEVAATTNPEHDDESLATLADPEAAADLAVVRDDPERVLRFERAVENGGSADLIHVVGRLAAPVETSDGFDFETAAAHLSIDVSATRDRIAARARTQFLVSLAGVVTVTFVALLALRWAVSRRVRRLQAAIATAVEGSAPTTLSGYGTDVIGQLADALSESFNEIAERTVQLADTNRWLEDEMARRQAAEAETFYQTRHDALTGLVNRIVAVEYATAALSISDWSSDRRLAALHVNLDRFKVVNDSLGHDAGDHVLLEQARRLLRSVGADDLVARVSGDEFIVLLDERSEADVTTIAGSLVEILEFPVELGDDNDIFGSASIGVASARPGDDAEALLRRAGLALGRAKASGRATFVWFDEDMQAAIEARAELESSLRYAIEEARPGHSQLELHYQPIVELGAGRIRGFEALVRWRRDGELVPPGDFIELAEDSGLIVPLGVWILKEAMAQAGRWQHLYPERPPVVTINVSGHQLSAGGVPAMIRAALVANRVQPELVTIELTESVLLDDIERAKSTLAEIKHLGVKLAADDFGTGYSSLTYLREFPFDVVKVDQSFVRHLGDDAADSTIVAAVVAMAKALGLRVVCEGVETREQVAGLMMLGADDGQGWFFAKAMPADLATRVFAAGLAEFDEMAGAPVD